MTDLDNLIEAVQAGDNRFSSYLPSGNEREWPQIYKAMDGSLDAAKALHEDLLHNHVISSLDWKWGGLVEAHIFEVSPEQWHEPGMAKFVGRSSTPARAWLIAILKAYRSKVQE